MGSRGLCYQHRSLSGVAMIARDTWNLAIATLAAVALCHFAIPALAAAYLEFWSV